MKRKCVILLAGLLLLTGCAKPNIEGTALYYINSQGNGLDTVELNIADESRDTTVKKIMDALQDESILPQGGKTVLQNGLKVASYSVEDSNMNIDLSGDYGSLTNTNKLLLTAGLTKSFEQIEGIDRVYITIQGQPLLDSKGNEQTAFSADDFVIHSGNEINTYSNTKICLYFVDDEGEISSEERNAYYSSNIPVEQLVLQELIKGPYNLENKAVLPSNLNFNNVTVQNDICYVNFDESIMELIQGYDIAKAFEAIARSMSANCGVKKVQFSVNGDTSVEIGGISLDKIYEIN